MSVYLVIFGAAVRADGAPSGSLIRRVQGAVEAGRGIDDAWFVATGGQGRFGPPEALVIRDLLVKAGIPSSKILVEHQATDTFESIRYCDKIIRPRGDADLIIVCSSRYHNPRCALLFRMLGYRVSIPVMPADGPHLPKLKLLRYYAKEFISLPYDAIALFWLKKTLRRD